MPRRNKLLAFAICIAAHCNALSSVADEPKLPDGSEQQQPFGSIQAYDTSNNELLGGSKEKKDVDGKSAKGATEPGSSSATKSSATNGVVNLTRMPQSGVTLVNELGGPRQIIIEGASRFSEKEIRQALARDLKYQAAARPTASTLEFLTVIEQRLRDGYRSCGCPDALIRAKYDLKRDAIVVQIDEGPQYHREGIEVIGVSANEQAALAKWLTSPQRAPGWTYLVNDRPLDVWSKEAKQVKTGRYGEAYDERPAVAEQDATKRDAQSKSSKAMAHFGEAESTTFWRAEGRIDFDRVDVPQLQKAVRMGLLHLGYTNCEFSTEVVRDPQAGTAKLRISFPNPPEQLKVAEIEIAGLERDSRESLLNYLEISTGDVIDAKLLRKIADRLADSCRYWTYGISVAVSDPSNGAASDGAKLQLKLEEYENVPALDKPLTHEQEILRRCGKWIQSLNDKSDRGDLVCTTEMVALGGGLQQAQIGYSADGTLAIRGSLNSTMGVRANHTLIAGSHGIKIYDWSEKSKFLAGGEALPIGRVQLTCDHLDDGQPSSDVCLDYRLRTSSDASERPTCLQFILQPVAMVSTLDREGVTYKSKNGVLTVQSNSFELCIDEKTGVIQSIKSAGFLPFGVSAFDFKIEKGFVAKLVAEAEQNSKNYANAFDENNAWGSALAFACGQLKRQPVVQRTPSLATACRNLQTVAASQVYCEHLAQWTKDVLPFARSDEFSIPASFKTDQQFGAIGFLLIAAPNLADQIFPRGSWPWTASREIAFQKFVANGADESHADYQKLSNAELNRALFSKDYGPVTALCTAKWFERVCGRNARVIIEHVALRGSSDLSDEAFKHDIRLITTGNHSLATICREWTKQCSSLSDEEVEDLQIYMPAEAHDLVKQLVARRKAKPDEPPGDALEAVLLDAWHNGLKDVVEAELRKLTTHVAEVPKVEATR